MSHRQAKGILAALLFALFAPILLRGHVIVAHDNALETGAYRPPETITGLVEMDARAERRSNHKFADQTAVFLPEIHHHLRGNPSGWISTWNPHPELGRPTAQIAGAGPAYFVTHALSKLTDDALWLYTWQVVLAVALTALFGYLLCEALGLLPTASLCGATGLGLGVFTTYWFSFVLFTWTITWTLALLWVLARILRSGERPGPGALLAIAFLVHALFLSGYPQQIVWGGYLIVGFLGWRLLSSTERWPARLATLGLVGAAALVGLASVAPVYADLAQTAARSARLEAAEEFFLKIQTPIESIGDLLRYVALRFDAFVLGNPIAPDYPVRFNGLTMTPLFAIAVATTLRAPLVRRLWPLQVFVVLCVATDLSPLLYGFGIRHLGLNVSRTAPLVGAFVPGVLLAAYGVDALVRGGGSRAALALGAAAATTFALALWTVESPLDPLGVGISAALVGGSLVLAARPSWRLAGLLAVASTLGYSLRLPLSRPPAEFHRDSNLVSLVRRETADGTRFAWLDRIGSEVLAPNQESLLGLRSIHTYNSLSAKGYQEWVAGLTPGGTRTLGRHFRSLRGERVLADPDLAWAGVSLILAQGPVDSPLVERVAEASGDGAMYRFLRRPVLEAQLRSFDVVEGRARVRGRPTRPDGLALHREREFDDRIEFVLTETAEPTLLFVSQQHHPNWHAFAGDEELETVVVNDFYQGVVVPPGTGRVELVFLPLSRFSWIPQALFALAGLGFGLRRLHRLHSSP